MPGGVGGAGVRRRGYTKNKTVGRDNFLVSYPITYPSHGHL